MPPPPARQPAGCIFGAFFFLGLALFAFFAWGMVLPGLRARFFFVETRCTVLDKRLFENDDTWRPELQIKYTVNGREYGGWTYDAAGSFRGGRPAQQAVLDGFVKGHQYPCWYDPADPRKAVLDRSLDASMLICLFPLAFVAVGAGGVMYSRRRGTDRSADKAQEEPWSAALGNSLGAAGIVAAVGFVLTLLLAFGLFFALGLAGAPAWAVGAGFFGPFLVFTIVLVRLGRQALSILAQRLPTPERRAAQVARVEDRQATATSEGHAPAVAAADLAAALPEGDWPTVPRPPTATEKATTLAVRLQPEGVPAGCALGCLAVVTLAWLAFAVPHFITAVQDQLRGQANRGAMVLPTVFLAIGVAMLGGVVLFLARWRAGRVALELSAHPLQAGGRYELWAVQQEGRVPVRQVHIRLYCQESATYRQGTSTSTSTREVCSREVLIPGLDPGCDDLTQGVRCDFVVPPSAMHSFEAKHNKIAWKLELRGRVGRWPLRLKFPVIVYPAAEGCEEHA
jgi:hypothetical protein